MSYQVIQLLKNNAFNLLAEFNDVNDARLFVNKMDTMSRYQIVEQDLQIENPFNVVTKSKDAEIVVARFNTITAAKDFIQFKLQDDAKQNINVTYYLLDGDQFVEGANQSHPENKQPKNSIRPRPPSLLLRPPGSAYGIYNADDDEKDNNSEDNK